MNDVFGWQFVGTGELGITNSTPTKLTTLCEQIWASCSVYSTINPTSPRQELIGCIHDDIDMKRRDIRVQGSEVHGNDFTECARLSVCEMCSKYRF